MRLQFILFSIISILLIGCSTNDSENVFDIQGHRGTRGTLPENSIAGFVKATELGVNTLEMDVVITKDKQVIVSHEPWMSHSICSDSLDNPIIDSTEMKWNIYEMTFAETQKFDCGSIQHANFPNQKPQKSFKPLLSTVINAVEKINPNIQYNIEIKSKLEGDGIYHPKPDKFVDLVYQVIDKENAKKRTIIQSFDPRPLMIVNDRYPDLRTAYLTANQLGYRHNLTRLDYKPTIFSPRSDFVTQGMIDFFHNEGIKVIPWTVNDVEEMKKIKALGADGLITDYPEIAIEALKE